MSDEEDDYMSSAVLASIPDVRPGISRASEARQIQMEKRKMAARRQNCRISGKQLESDRRETALSTALPAENRGFALMSKMGYKAGMSLGKSPGGLTEPVGIELKSDRKGLGHQAQLMEKRSQLEVIRAKRLKIQSEMSGDYRTRVKDAVMQKEIAIDLLKCQKACRELDIQQTLSEPLQPYYWPPTPKTVEEEEDQSDSDSEEIEEELKPADKLRLVANYLRSEYRYCHWCGTKYDDEADLQQNCPGDTSEAHQ